MSVQAVHDDRQRRRFIWGGQYNVSASDSARVVVGSTAHSVVYGSTFAGQDVVFYIYAGEPVATLAVEEYDPAFVSEILAADAAPPEAAFDNVVDMLDWLSRD